MARPTIRQLEYAVAVAQHGKFTTAAQAVHVSQPTLSGQIAELEHRLGTVLFERSARKIYTTTAGLEVVRRATEILKLSDEMSQVASQFRGTIYGTVRFAAIPTMAPYLLPQAMKVLKPMWPDAHLLLQEKQSQLLVEDIEKGATDIGLLALPYDTASLKAVPLHNEPFHLALPIDHPLANRRSALPLEVLNEFDVMLLEPGHCLRDHVLSACVEAGQNDTTEIHGTSLSTLAQMVANGSGVTLLPAGSLSVEVRPGNGIIAKKFKRPAPFRTIALAWRNSDPRDRYFTEFSREFKRVLRQLD